MSYIRAVVNIFCPTGPGGGINPSCGARGVMRGPDAGVGPGGSGSARPKLTAVQKKILDAYDIEMTKRMADYHRTKAADEAHFGFKIAPPSGVETTHLPFRRLSDLEDLRDKGVISMRESAHRIVVTRLDKPPSYYDPPEIPGM